MKRNLQIISSILFVHLAGLMIAVCAHAQVSEFEESVESLSIAWDEEQDAIDKITELGGWVELGSIADKELEEALEEGKRQFVIEVNMVYHEEGAARSDNQNLSADALPQIAKFSQARTVLLRKTQANDKGLIHLKGLKHLEAIYIWDATDVSDAGVAHLSELLKLKKLHISNSKMTDAGFKCLENLSEMEEFSLQGNHFTDETLALANKFPNLKSLWVGMGTSRFSDAGIEALYDCKLLEVLDLQGSSISNDAIEKLQEKIPSLKEIHR
jgi:hypothetical protein